jgi:hypothetical protein
MEEAINWVNVLDFSFFILGWVKHARLNELRTPSSLFFVFDFLKNLV